MSEVLPEQRHLGRKNTMWSWFVGVIGVLCVSWCAVPGALAQTVGELEIDPALELGEEYQRPIVAIVVETLGTLWHEPTTVQSVRVGDMPSGAVVRRALRELDRTGRYADLRARLLARADGVVLVLQVRPRKLVQNLRFTGSILKAEDERRALSISEGDGVTERTIERARRSLARLYRDAGYPQARISIRSEEVDDPRRVLLRIGIEPGTPQKITGLYILVAPVPHHPELQGILAHFGVRVGDRLDSDVVEEAKEELLDRLVREAFYEAKLSHRVTPAGGLELRVVPGRRYTVRIEGNEAFGATTLESELELASSGEVEAEVLEEKLRAFYVRHGYLDATVAVRILTDGHGLRGEIYAFIQEGERFAVVQRLYPCLTGSRDAKALDAEINGVLSEHFAAEGLLGPVQAAQVDRMTGSVSPTPRPTPYRAAPWRAYSDESHQRVMEHLADLYHSEGYLEARVGPATLVRRRCSVDSPPSECRFEGPPPIPLISCEKPPEPNHKVQHTCVPRPEKGERCEPDAILVLPIFPGRQAVIYDVAIEGNQAFSEQELLKLADLPIGDALRRKDLEAALRRIQEHYQEQAYAFSEVDSEIELSADRSRARILISVTERHRVRVSRIDVRGAVNTSESLIRSRLALRVGDYFKRSRVRRSEERIEGLGVFTSVTVALDDPGVPAREKVVVVALSERLPQYLDTKGGFASADGFRIAFEYGHRNLLGQAIRLTLRSQLAIRPPFLIAEGDVREKYKELSALQRLERRNTVTLGFPNVGLGPLFGMEIEFLDLLDNQRDFSNTRDAGVLRFLFRPRRSLLFQVGGTVELNSADILGGQSLQEFCDDPQNDCTNVRVPEGRSIAYTQNAGASWDRRDVPLAATRGTYVGGSVEHVTAVPLGDSQGICSLNEGNIFDPVCSELLRYTSKLAGYIPFNNKGLALAVSLRGGVIQHLTEQSRTYPDRLFFMGGVDTLRGYTQYSLVPQDMADLLLEDGNITIDEVVLRGGDVFINPRVELRVPLNDTFQTAVFVDSGNLWADVARFNPLQLRYTVGTGLRIGTPVGPLVFDYGLNIERVLDKLIKDRAKKRYWEDLGAFHFSIGLF